MQIKWRIGKDNAQSSAVLALRIHYFMAERQFSDIERQSEHRYHPGIPEAVQLFV